MRDRVEAECQPVTICARHDRCIAFVNVERPTLSMRDSPMTEPSKSRRPAATVPAAAAAAALVADVVVSLCRSGGPSGPPSTKGSGRSGSKTDPARIHLGGPV